MQDPLVSSLSVQGPKINQSFSNEAYRPEKSDLSKDDKDLSKPRGSTTPTSDIHSILKSTQQPITAYVKPSEPDNDLIRRYKEEMQDVLDLINSALSYDDKISTDEHKKVDNSYQGPDKSIFSPLYRTYNSIELNHDNSNAMPGHLHQRRDSHRVGDHHFVPSLKLVNEEAPSPVSSSGTSLPGNASLERPREKNGSSIGSSSMENSDVDESINETLKSNGKMTFPRSQSAAYPLNSLPSPSANDASKVLEFGQGKRNQSDLQLPLVGHLSPSDPFLNRINSAAPQTNSQSQLKSPDTTTPVERQNYNRQHSMNSSIPGSTRRVSFANDNEMLVFSDSNISRNSIIPEREIFPERDSFVSSLPSSHVKETSSSQNPFDTNTVHKTQPSTGHTRDNLLNPMNLSNDEKTVGLSKGENHNQPTTRPTEPSSNPSGQGRSSSQGNTDRGKESSGAQRGGNLGDGSGGRGYDNFGMNREGDEDDPQMHAKPRPSIISISPLRPVFIEMDKLRYRRYYQWHWHEMSRWFQQEENYDEMANDFDAPHSPILSFEAVMHFSKQLENGIVLFDVSGMRHLNDLMEHVVDLWTSEGHCSDAESNGLRDVLMLIRKHVTEKYTKSEIKALSYHMYSHALLQLLGEQDLDPLEFMADESRGRRGSNADDMFRARQERLHSVADVQPQISSPRQRTVSIVSRNPCDTEVCTVPRQFTPWLYLLPQHHFHSRLNERLPPNTETVSIMVGVVRQLQRPLLAFVRLSEPMYTEGATEVYKFPLRFLFIYLVPRDWPVRPEEVGRCFGAMMVDREFRRRAFDAKFRDELLHGVTFFLKRSLVLPVNKYSTKESLGGMIERVLDFKHKAEAKEQSERRRRMSQTFRPAGAADLTSELSFGFYSRKASRVEETNQLQKGVGSRHVSALKEPELPSQESGISPSLPSSKPLSESTPPVSTGGPIDLQALVQEQAKGATSKKSSRLQSCVGGWPFKNLISDLHGWTKRVVSDWIDPFRPADSLSIVLMGSFFVYFAILAPAITFGALLKTQVNAKMGVASCIVSSGVFQFLFAIFGGQPLNIVGHTGPLFIVEISAASFAKSMQQDALAMRFWVGIYTSILGILVQCFNGVRIIQFIRGSTTEIFNAFIALFFILKALFTMLKPIPFGWNMFDSVKPTNDSCRRVQKYTYQMNDGRFFCAGDWIFYSQQTTGLFIAFMMLFICLFLVGIKRGRFLRRRARIMLGSLNVPISIIIVTIVSLTIFRVYELPTLAIPQTVDPSGWIAIPDWEQTFNPDVISTGKFHGFCIVIAICLTILIFTETAMSSATLAKPDRKIQKPPLFSLDQFIVGVIFPIVSGCLGWPFVSAAIVRANTHQMAMFKIDYNTPPGVPPKMTGCVEQRLSGFLVGFVTALSVFLGPILQLIPIHAMYGMFLYMGIMGLRDLLMKHRFIALLKRKCHWKDYDYLRGLPRWQLAAFVGICWGFCLIMVTLNIISEFLKTASWVALIFPLFVVLYMLTRALILPKVEWLSQYLEVMDKKTKIAMKQPKRRKSIAEILMQTLPSATEAPKGATGEGAFPQPRPEDLAAAAQIRRESAMLAQDLLALRKLSLSGGKDVENLSLHSDSSSDNPQDSEDEHMYAVKNTENPYPHA